MTNADEATTRRQARYGSLRRGWDWRTTKERLDAMERHRVQLALGKTEYLEQCVDAFLSSEGNN